MHIAVFTDLHPATLGGVQTSVNAQRRSLEQRGHRVTLITTRAAGAGADPELFELPSLPGLSGMVRFLTRGLEFVLVGHTKRNRRRVDEILSARGPVDVVHLHGSQGVSMCGLSVARERGIPVVQTMHTREDVFLELTSPLPYLTAFTLSWFHSHDIPHPRSMPRLNDSRTAHWAWRMMVAQAQAADHLVIPTEQFAAAIRAHGVSRPISLLSNGVDDDALDLARAVRSDQPDPAAALRVVWCGRFSSEKRLLEAIAAVLPVKDAVLDIYGEGGLREEAERMIDAAGAEHRIRLHGKVSQTDCLIAMANSDVVLFNSYGADTQGMVLLEAIAMSLPVVYCDPNLDETVPPGGGIRALSHHSASIAGVLTYLVRDRMAIQHMRGVLAAHADDVRQSRVTGELLALYVDLIAGRQPVAAGDQT